MVLIPLNECSMGLKAHSETIGNSFFSFNLINSVYGG